VKALPKVGELVPVDTPTRGPSLSAALGGPSCPGEKRGMELQQVFTHRCLHFHSVERHNVLLVGMSKPSPSAPPSISPVFTICLSFTHSYSFYFRASSPS
jgi:hypothetical protein